MVCAGSRVAGCAAIAIRARGAQCARVGGGAPILICTYARALAGGAPSTGSTAGSRSFPRRGAIVIYFYARALASGAAGSSWAEGVRARVAASSRAFPGAF